MGSPSPWSFRPDGNRIDDGAHPDRTAFCHGSGGDGRRRDNDKRVEAFLALLHREVRRHRPASFYADALGISTTHLNRVVKAKTGFSTQELIARRLLRKHSVNCSSRRTQSRRLRSGWLCRPAYFSRFFTRQTGPHPETLETAGTEAAGFAAGLNGGQDCHQSFGQRWLNRSISTWRILSIGIPRSRIRHHPRCEPFGAKARNQIVIRAHHMQRYRTRCIGPGDDRGGLMISQDDEDGVLAEARHIAPERLQRIIDRRDVLGAHPVRIRPDHGGWSPLVA